MAEDVQSLKIIITAENKAAIAALKQAAEATDAFGISVKKTSAVVDNAAAATDVLSAKLARLKKELENATDPRNIGILNNSIKQTEQQLELINAAAQQTGANIEKGMAKATTGFTSAITNARKLQFVLRSLAGVGLFQLFTLGAEAAVLMATGVDKSAKKTKEFADEYIKALDAAQESSQKEIATVQSLIAVASNESLSKDKRKRALAELNKEYPGYFNNTDKDLTDTAQLKKITDDLSGAIIRRGKAEAFATLIGKENAKLWEAQHSSIEQQEEKLGTVTKAWDFLKGSIQAGASPVLGAMNVNMNLLNSTLEEQQTSIKNAKANIASLTVEINKNTEQQFLNNDLGKLETKTTKEKDDAYAKLAKSLKEINGLYQDRLIDNNEFNAKSIEAYQTALETLAKNGIDPLSSAFQNLIDKQNEFIRPRGNRGKIAETISYEKQNDFDPLSEKKLLPGEKKPLLSNPNETDNEQKRKDLIALSKEAATAANQLASAFVNAVSSGENMGTALIKVFEELAKKIAQAAIEALIFTAIIDAASGGTADAGSLAGATGGGLSGFGSIFKKLLGFAGGGTVSGPTSGYPVMLHGTEHIMQPGQLQSIVAASAQMGSSMGGGNNANQTLQTRISGNDLLIWIERANYSMNVRR